MVQPFILMGAYCIMCYPENPKNLQSFPLLVGLLRFISIVLYYFHFSILASTSPFGSQEFILKMPPVSSKLQYVERMPILPTE